MCDDTDFPNASSSWYGLVEVLSRLHVLGAVVDLGRAEAVVGTERIDPGAAVLDAYVPWLGELAWPVAPWFAQAVRDWLHAWSHFRGPDGAPASVDLRTATVTWGDGAMDINGQLARALRQLSVGGVGRHGLDLPAGCPSWCPGPPEPEDEP